VVIFLEGAGGAVLADGRHAHDALVLRASVRDDGRGGAGFGRGSGLVGLKDRVEALGGRIRLDSPPGAGTALDIILPLGDPTEPRRQAGTADPAQEG
jgi:glucose-6-phosphate-specific signal transduction histidine kinase